MTTMTKRDAIAAFNAARANLHAAAERVATTAAAFATAAEVDPDGAIEFAAEALAPLGELARAHADACDALAVARSEVHIALGRLLSLQE